MLDEESVGVIQNELRREPAIIWFCRRARDTSGDHLITRLERELSLDREVLRYDFLPYDSVQLRIIRWLRGPEQPAYFYELVEMNQRFRRVGV